MGTIEEKHRLIHNGGICICLAVGFLGLAFLLGYLGAGLLFTLAALVGIVAWIMGVGYYLMGKGYSILYCFLACLGLIGWIIMILLPDRWQYVESAGPNVDLNVRTHVW